MKTENLTLKEAYENANYDDFIGRRSGVRWAKKDIGSFSNISLSFSSAMKNDWEIIKKEPKILNVREIIASTMQRDGEMAMECEYRRIRMAMQNGRLERDLEFRPLIDSVSKLFDKADHDGVSKITQKIFDEFENLKPLNKE